ncbi:GNAT family N-acetyltransferase [Dendronalium sp. ChiSLP03b]|uniref:GNAT family N-acetyltransferase n=1 Tax=Dendronalium sp. ChiSLP03b TaxID=3075381 RepID=UPI002AD4C996|nr:GNAT family N-acetyltransferase [Dendronalium sp. ChiSLP03b]MDZ8206782.1 GNAT family N-acetyltransferase [Dendronalium sp. ChiSLP03b]
MIPNIRNLTEADFKDIDPVLMAAYGKTSSFKSDLQRYLALQPDGWLIAECDGVPVGMVGAVDYGAIAYVGVLGVHPTFQRQGIGLMLMKQILEWLDKRGCPSVVLDATTAGVPIYARLGFIEVEKSLVFQQETAPQFLPSRTKRVSALRSTDLTALAAFDTPLFGADRQTVFAAFLSEFPDRAFIAYDQTGQVVGYLLAQPQNLGPWAASTLEAAEALLARGLLLPFEDVPRVLLPGSNRIATTLLMRYRFTKQSVLSHMCRGKNTALGKRAMLYGMASFALG